VPEQVQKLRPYQEEGVQFLLDHPRSLLCDEMGTGKSPTAATALARSGAQEALIVCPKVVLEKWVREIYTWAPAFLPVVFSGTPTERARAWEAYKDAPRPKVLITNYAQLANVHKLQYYWPTMILDECVPLDTEILTAGGWKTYDQLTVGERVVGYEGGRLIWTELLGINLPGKRPVGTLRARGFQAVTTANHEWVVRDKYTGKERKIGSAEHKPRGDHIGIVLAAPFTGGGLDITPSEAALIGWILSEGGIYPMKSYKGRPTSYSAFIYQTKPDTLLVLDRVLQTVEHTKKCLNPEGQPGGFGSKNLRYRYRVSIAHVRDVFGRAGLSVERPKANLVPFVLGLSPEARRAFCEAVELAEGNNAGEKWLYTKKDGTSKKQRDICQKPGPVQDAFRLAFFLEGYYTSMRSRETTFGLTRATKQVDSLVWSPQEEPQEVWCPTTGTGNWVMRQGDLICITGNCQAVKNRKTKTWRTASQFKQGFLWLLSGTPMSKGPQDLWAYLNLIDRQGFYSFWKYCYKYLVVTEGYFGKIVGGPKNPEQLRSALKPYLIRRTKKQVMQWLPTKVRDVLDVELLPTQKRLYKELAAEAIAELEEGEGEYLITKGALGKITRLRQLCISPTLLDERLPGDSSSFAAAREFLNSLGRPCIVFTPWTSVFPLFIEHVARKTEGETSLYYIQGGMSSVKLYDSIQAFEQDPNDNKVLLCTISLGAGFDVFSATHALFIGADWSPVNNLQAEDRLRGAANVYYIRHKGTIEEHVYDVVAEKKQWSDVVINPHELLYGKRPEPAGARV
jgi:hypothetical protein